MRTTISKEEVRKFKELCGENRIVSEILKNEFQDYFLEPILDVGAGIGDICFYTCPEKEVYLVDINDFGNDFFNPKHKRSVKDFFEFVPERPIKTAFISHTLQYIDHDVNKLMAKISDLNPENIILIVNENEGFIKNILKWVNENCKDASPGMEVSYFTERYNLKDKKVFIADLVCDTFDDLADQVAYLMLFDYTEDIKNKLISFLKEEIGGKPAFQIHQAIYLFNSK